MQNVKVKGQSVQKLEWKRMDRRADGGDCITRLTNEVGKYSIAW